MKNIETKKIEKEILKISKNFKNDEKIKDFEKSLKSFKDLVKKGYIKERGNNLLTTNEYTSNYVTFNLKNNF